MATPGLLDALAATLRRPGRCAERGRRPLQPPLRRRLPPHHRHQGGDRLRPCRHAPPRRPAPPRLAPTLSVKDALKALFGLALYPLNRAALVRTGAVPPLFSLIVKDGRARIVEDCTAVVAQVVLLLVWIEGTNAMSKGSWVHLEVDNELGEKHVLSHSCIHDEILQQRRRPGRKEYSVSPQVYSTSGLLNLNHRRGRALLEFSSSLDFVKDARQPIRIFLNYDAVGHSQDRDCRDVGDIVKLGEPPATSIPGSPACNPHGDPPIFGDCWYNCTSEDIAVADKKLRLRKALEQTVEWFKRTLSVEPVKGNLRLSGYSACGQDGGVQLPHEYIEDGVADADVVLLVTTRPTTGNTLAWAVACERDQWGRAIVMLM